MIRCRTKNFEERIKTKNKIETNGIKLGIKIAFYQLKKIIYKISIELISSHSECQLVNCNANKQKKNKTTKKGNKNHHQINKTSTVILAIYVKYTDFVF